MWAGTTIQLLAVGGRVPTEHGMHKHSTDVVAKPDRVLVPNDPQASSDEVEEEPPTETDTDDGIALFSA